MPRLTSTRISRSIIETPIGRLALTATPQGLAQVDLLAERVQVEPAIGSPESTAHLGIAERALTAYFAGSPDAFPRRRDGARKAPTSSARSGLRFAAFPKARRCRIVQLAERIGKPDAVRAVGLANGRNPIPIVVPCHRVIGTDRSLTGFGLGVPVKAWLLVHERAAEPFPAGVSAATRVVAPASLW